MNFYVELLARLNEECIKDKDKDKSALEKSKGYYFFIRDETHYEMERIGIKYSENEFFGKDNVDLYWYVKRNVEKAFLRRAYEIMSRNLTKTPHFSVELFLEHPKHEHQTNHTF